jgi:hypothetical protein
MLDNHLPASRSAPNKAKLLAKSLGVLGIGAGALEALAPELVAELLGVEKNRNVAAGLRGNGLREIATGIGLLSGKAPHGWMWARAGGSLLALGLLADGLSSRRARRDRLWMSIGAVAGLALLEGLTAYNLRAEGPAAADETKSSRSVTIRRERSEVEGAWAAFVNSEKILATSIRFEAAPGDRGTEVHATHAKGQGMALESQLRRFKQRMETGEVVHSDASIHTLPHPARPARSPKGARS